MKSMKTWKKFGALLCAGTLVFALGACNGGDEGDKTTGEDDPQTEDVGALLAAAEDKIASVKNMDAEMLMDMDMTISDGTQEQKMKTVSNMKITMFQDPIQVKVDMNMDMDMGEMGAQNVDMEMYIMEEAGTYTLYQLMADQWSSQVIELAMVDQYDPQKTMSLYMGSAEEFKADGEDTVQGEKAKKYTGVISGEAMDEVIDASGVAQNMETMMGGMELDMEALYSDLGDLPISVWLNEAGYPVRYQMDMTNMMNKIYAKLVEQMGAEAEGASITCDRVEVSMDCYNFDGAEEIVLPAEATA